MAAPMVLVGALAGCGGEVQSSPTSGESSAERNTAKDYQHFSQNGR